MPSLVVHLAYWELVWSYFELRRRRTNMKLEVKIKSFDAHLVDEAAKK